MDEPDIQRGRWLVDKGNLGISLRGETASTMAEALVWAKEFFEARDQMNAKAHCAPVRLSPITERVIGALSIYEAEVGNR